MEVARASSHASMHARRLSAARDLMEQEGSDALVLCHPANVFYLSGYWTILSSMSPEALVITRSSCSLVVPALETPAAEACDLSLLTVVGYRRYALPIGGQVSPPRAFQDGLAEALTGAKNIAADLDALLYPVVSYLQAIARGGVSDFGGRMRGLRAAKDPTEVEAIRQAASIAASAAAEAHQHVAEGRTEHDIARAAAASVWSSGGTATHIVVGSGPRSALTHPEPTRRALRQGDLVLLDIGVLYQGYWAEIARTWSVGIPGERVKRWHRVVLEAQRAAAEVLKPGAFGGEVDHAARRTLLRDGFDGRYFTHAAGHGLGILGMDGPLIAPESQDRIPETCAVTIEPGLYVAGDGGVRIEDTYLVLNREVESPTQRVPASLLP